MKKRLHNMKLMSDPESEAARKKALAAIDRGRMEGASSAIAAKIRRRLRILGMSNAEFANAIGTYPSTVSKWLSGSHNFELKTLVDIEDILDIIIIDRNVISDKSLTESSFESITTLSSQEKYSVNVKVYIDYNSARKPDSSESIESQRFSYEKVC